MLYSPHVLIAEDEDLVAVVVAEVLESEGFRVTVTHNGLEAIEADAADPADLLLTDMRMPVMGGEALIRIIRQRRPELPIVVTTGFSEYLPVEEPEHLRVLRKPYSLPALVAMIKALLVAARDHWRSDPRF
ncbi:response regulator [Azospirillum sp. CT11-132]|uniref:response regulator n=1 Tax=Azospirillum sp. CT11-132 TaxID=3396317 RepID=UPI0039A58FCE